MSEEISPAVPAADSSRTWLSNVTWTAQDQELVTEDLGREPRGVVGVGARRQDGHPLVVITAPRLPGGIPFPTTFYLTDPTLTTACSRLEADHFMEDLAERLASDEAFAASHRRAHDDYLGRRRDVANAAGIGVVPEIEGISAGGLPTRVKCLHALVGHSLVAGPGVNLAGDAALEEMRARGLIDQNFAWLSATHLPPLTRHTPNSGSAPSENGGEATPVPARQANRSVPEMRRVAAIDCGTNSIRLLIADVPVTQSSADARDLVDLDRDMVITRLGEGVDQTGELSEAAVDRTLKAARVYQGRIDRAQVTRTRVAATSATRDAANRSEFTEAMAAITGVIPEVITGHEEASLSFIGAVSALPAGVAGPFLVVDIGGGSTEFVLGDSHVMQSVSMDMGSVRVTERFGPEPWTLQRQDAARRWIDTLLDQAEQQVDFSAAKTVVGVAGTVTSLAALVFGVEEYSPEVTHGSSPSTRQWREALDFMINRSVETKGALAAMPPGRADVIGGGALVWERVLVRLGVLDDDLSAIPTAAGDGEKIAPTINSGQSAPLVVVSEHDILDGLALSAAQG